MKDSFLIHKARLYASEMCHDSLSQTVALAILLDYLRWLFPDAERFSERPRVVCLCGSSKFPDYHMREMMRETLKGNIIVPMGLYGHADFPKGAKAATNDGDESTDVKQMLDRLHFAKIDLADEILVVNVDGYVGDSTKREIAYALSTGKAVRFTEPNAYTNEPEYQKHMEDLAATCCCCADCGDVPCGGCQAGSVCDDMPCHCDDDYVSIEDQ